VKITGCKAAPTLPLLPDDELSPEPCLSEELVKLEPIEDTLFPIKDDLESLAVVSDGQEAEFGEFLLDAMEWL
jgi:hypothetical protein